MDYSTYSLDSNNSRDDTAIANELLKKVDLPAVKDLSECTSSVFVALCEGILGDPLPGVAYAPVTKEDEIHNVQLVVDHLAQEVLHCDLSHIGGRAVVEGDRLAIQYLLEILLGVMDYIMGGIESAEGSTTDNEDHGDLVDPDTMTRGTVSAITKVLREELGPRARDVHYRPTVSDDDRPSNDSQTISDISKHLSRPYSQSEGESTAELIALGARDVDSEAQGRPRGSKNLTGELPSTDWPTGQSLDDQPTKLTSAVGGKAAIAPRSPAQTAAADSSTTGLPPGRQKDDLTLQDLTSSTFSSVSWPKPPPPQASDHRQPPGEFDSLGIRPRPAAFVKDRPPRPAPAGYGTEDSLAGSMGDSQRQHHVHTHHHYHQPVSHKPSTSTGASSKSPPPATLSRPPVSGQSSPAKHSPPRELTKKPQPRVGSSWHEHLADRDDALPKGPSFGPRRTYPAALRSTHPAPSGRRPTSSLALARSAASSEEHAAGRTWRDAYPDDSDDWWKNRLRRVEEGFREDVLPPRPRRVAFVDDDAGDERDRSQRSFYRETLGSITSLLRHENSDSEEDSDSEVLSQCSDTAIDYRLSDDYRQGRRVLPAPATRDGPSDRPYDLRPRSEAARVDKKRRPQPRPKSVLLPTPQARAHRVRFEDALDADATGPMSRIRKKLTKENRKHSRQKEVLRFVYKSNLEEAKTGLKRQLDRNKRVLDKQDADYRKVFTGPKTSKYQPGQKYTAKVTTDRSSRPAVRSRVTKRKRSASASPTMHRHKRLSIGEDEMLPTVMKEFPFLHVSPQTAHAMWAKQMSQMEQLTRMSGDQRYKRTRTQLKMEEAEQRQEVLLKIMKKELSHNQRMRETKERKANEQATQRRVQEQRQVNARARRYYDEFQLRSRSRMMKRRTREEQIFKKLFEDGLSIQKARIADLRKYAREKRENLAQRQQDEIDSLENYYRNQFSMLAEVIAKERYDLQTRDRAQTKVMERMKRDMRRKMEQEVRGFQEQMYHDEDTEYFRQLESDRMRRELQMASYKMVI